MRSPESRAWNEKAVRYHLQRQAEGAVGGRSRQSFVADGFAEAIEHWRESVESGGADMNVTLHEYLQVEHDYPGSVRSLQRFMKKRYPANPVSTALYTEEARTAQSGDPTGCAVAGGLAGVLALGGRRAGSSACRLNHNR